MTKSWYKNFKWKSNPFFVKSNPNLIGVEKEKELLLDYLDSGNMCFIHGESGIGKTSMLRFIELKVKGTAIYLDCEGVSNDFDINSYIKAHRSLWRGLFGNYSSKVILLVDESQDSSKELRNKIKLLWESGNIKSVVFSQIDTSENMSKALKNRIGSRVLRLGKMSNENAIEMIEMRTQGRNPFEKEAIRLISEKSGYLPRKILENCERICIEFSRRGGKKKNIDVYDVENVLGKARKSYMSIEKTTKEELSPMQTKIIDLLKESGKTANQLANILKTSEGSVGKQLSKLSNLGKIKVLSEKRPKIYGISQ